MRTRIFLFPIMLSLTFSVFAQGQPPEAATNKDQEEEVAANKRLAEIMRKPSFINLRLVSISKDPNESPTDTPPPYKVGDQIDFQLLMTQTLWEPIVIWQMLDPYDNLRLDLTRDGDVVAYSKKATENIARTESKPPSGSGAPVQLQPGLEVEWARVQLRDWYKPLDPGRYHLTVRRRFTWDGEWIESNPIVFVVQ